MVFVKKWDKPDGFIEMYADNSLSILDAAVAYAEGDLSKVTLDMFLKALRDNIRLNPAQYSYASNVALYTIQQFAGSNVYFKDLNILDLALKEGRYPPTDPVYETFNGTAYSTTSRTLDLANSTGVHWRIPQGFLKKYNAKAQDIMHKLAADAKGWNKVTPQQYVEAVRFFLSDLSAEEEDYIYNICNMLIEPNRKGEPVNILFLDKCIQQGRTLTSIKGPVLLPTIFLNDTTSSSFRNSSAMTGTYKNLYLTNNA